MSNDNLSQLIEQTAKRQQDANKIRKFAHHIRHAPNEHNIQLCCCILLYSNELAYYRNMPDRNTKKIKITRPNPNLLAASNFNYL